MGQVSIIRNDSVDYPKAGQLSPDELFPEYAYSSHGFSGRNHVYPLIRQCLKGYGCDIDNYDSSRWNPLGKWIEKGNRVFVLTNFVVHRRPWESRERFLAKCTHASVIRAVLDYAIIAAGDAHLVSFGNAPLQGCNYAEVTEEAGATELTTFFREASHTDIGPHDLRLWKSRWTNFGALLDIQKEPLDHAVQFDLGSESWLDDLFEPHKRTLVRVGDYPPDDTMQYHGKGKHIYVVSKRILNADVIISIPKLKTHQKVGITCALKGTVGAIARKECLAHHRLGSPEKGGDEYPHAEFLRDMSSAMSERVCTLGMDLPSNLYRVTSKVLARAMRLGKKGITFGAWHGNDTAWRMVLDIARILRFGRLDGQMGDMPIRRHLALVDGIIAGEGEGPITPIPRRCGTVIFGDDICDVDTVCALVMGYDPRKIKMVSHAFHSQSYPITGRSMKDVEIRLNDKPVNVADILRSFAPAFAPPKGWTGIMEAGSGLTHLSR